MPSRHVIASSVLLSLGLAASLGSLACTTPAQIVEDNILMPLAPMAALQPSDSDLATRDLARAALLSDRAGIERSLTRLREIADTGLEPERNLVRRIPMSVDLRNSTLDDPAEYRAACRALERDVASNGKRNDPRLANRLEDCVGDDHLRLAQRRIWDAYESIWADAYNAVVEPLSRSLLSGGILAPYYIANSAATYLAGINERDAFPLQYRQALVHRERYLAHFPNAEEAPKVARQVESATRKLQRERAKKLVFRSNLALKNGNKRAAQWLADEAVATDPQNKRAAELAERAKLAIEFERSERLRSQGVAFDPANLEDAVRATGLLLAGSDLGSQGLSLLQRDQFADVGSYVVAAALAERGAEVSSWDRLRDLAGRDPGKSSMARHARALIQDPAQNPYGRFERVKSIQRKNEALWRVFGPFAQGPRYRRLPRPLAWLLDLPLLVNTVLFSPVRLIFAPISETPDFDRPVAITAYHYLDRQPEGEHKDELSSWLFDYESGRENWNAALRMADYLPSVDPEERSKLVEKAAEQQIARASERQRRDKKSSGLRQAAREFPDSEAGHRAGLAARKQWEGATAQSIRMTRSFLIENPQVAGPRALGIRREFVDGESANGELHPRGVSFIGGLYLEFEFLAASGDDKDPPNKVRQKISRERLTRLVAVLDDTARRNYRVDPDSDFAPDPRRELFIERARLGLTEEPDRRATAESTYVFRSARERFGMVRGRESILPFDLVVRGDFSSAGIAAFPRWRKPKETPDAFLYR